MSDELQMTDAARMERAIIRIALLLAPDDAAVGVNFDELPGQVQALVAERVRLREQVQGGRRLRFKLAGRNTRLRGVIEDAVAVFGAEEMDYDAWTETLGRMRRSLDVDDALNFGVEGGEVAGPTSPEYDAVVNQLMDVADERDRLQAAIKAHHFDVAHTAGKGIGVRASDHALYREAGLPDVGEADKETGAEFIARVETTEAERDRLRAVVEAIGAHDPTGEDHLAEMMEHAERADAAEVERDRLRAVVRKLWGAWNDATLNEPEAHDHGLDRDELRLLDGVIRDNPLQALALDGVNALIAERDRVRAVVEAARRWYQATDMDELQHAVAGLKAALRQLDESGVMGGDGTEGETT